MQCIFDKNSLQYMLEQFPRSLMGDIWTLFENNCKDGTIISELQSQKRLENELSNVDYLEWLKKNKQIFKSLAEKEAILLGKMMELNVFDFYNNPQLAERRLPEGIPFILCMAKIQGRYYVYRKNTEFLHAIKEICKKFDIKYLEIEEYLLKTTNHTTGSEGISNN